MAGKTGEYIIGGIGVAGLVGIGYYFYEKSHKVSAVPATARVHTVTRTVTKTQRVNGTPRTVRTTVVRTVTSRIPRTTNRTPVHTPQHTSTPRVTSTPSNTQNRFARGLPTPRNGQCPSGYTLSLDGMTNKYICIPKCPTGYASVYSTSQSKWICIPSMSGISPSQYAAELTSASSPYANASFSGTGAKNSAVAMAQALSARFPSTTYHIVLVGQTYYVVNPTSPMYTNLVENSQYRGVVGTAVNGSVTQFPSSYPAPTVSVVGMATTSCAQAFTTAKQLSAARGYQFQVYRANGTYYVVASPPSAGMAGVAGAIGQTNLASVLQQVGSCPTSTPVRTTTVRTTTPRTVRTTTRRTTVRTPQHTARGVTLNASPIKINGQWWVQMAASSYGITNPIYQYWWNVGGHGWDQSGAYGSLTNYRVLANQPGASVSLVVYAKSTSGGPTVVATGAVTIPLS